MNNLSNTANSKRNVRAYLDFLRRNGVTTVPNTEMVGEAGGSNYSYGRTNAGSMNMGSGGPRFSNATTAMNTTVTTVPLGSPGFSNATTTMNTTNLARYRNRSVSMANRVINDINSDMDSEQTRILNENLATYRAASMQIANDTINRLNAQAARRDNDAMLINLRRELNR